MMTAAGLLLAASLCTVPLDGGQLSFTQIAINNSLGDQFDPHVDGNLAAYSSVTGVDQTIHFYNFATAIDSTIAPAIVNGQPTSDLLSDVQGGRIVFTRVIPLDRTAIMMVDTNNANALTEINPQAGSNRIGVAVGGNTVAYSDLAVSSNGTGEIVAVNVTTGAPTQLTTDTVHDQNPKVSPDGKVIAWEHCAANIFNCDIWQAVLGASGWTVSATAATTLPEQDPDVSATRVIYTAARGATGLDVQVHPLDGSPEQTLVIDGDEMHPSISGDIIAFEHLAPGAVNADIFLYDLASNRLFQITNTPLFNEALNDVTVLPSGQVRVVWDSNDEDGINRNVYGATFSLPAPPAPIGPVCGNRAVTLEASRSYHPTHSTDASATLTPAMRFALPSSLPVIAGDSREGWATLAITTHGLVTTCHYRGTADRHGMTTHGGEVHDPGESDDDHGERDDDCGNGRPAAANHYAFRFCEGITLKPGDIVQADAVTLHLKSGHDESGTTIVRLTLNEDCGSTLAALKLERSDADPVPQTGCSASAGPIAPLWMLAAMGALWLLRARRSQIAVQARQERRKL
jgi:uncharacterized protein (TIGR03382 family)